MSGENERRKRPGKHAREREADKVPEMEESREEICKRAKKGHALVGANGPTEQNLRQKLSQGVIRRMWWTKP
ncbi:MAG: hypothetical protein ACLTMW_07715 [Blautia hydrogenotrophica]